MVDLSDLGPSSGGGVDLSDLGPSSSSQDQGTNDASLSQKLQMGWSALGMASQLQPTTKIQSGLNTAGNWIAEKGGMAGVNPYLAAGAGTAVKMIPQLVGAYAALPSRVQSGVQTAMSEIPQSMGQKLASEVGSVGGELPPSPAGAPPPETPPPILKAPNYLEQTGGAGLNAQTGIRGGTILKMTPKGQNPGAFGIQFAKQMQEQGVSASNPIEAWDSLNKLTQQAGQDVGSAKQAISDAAAKYGAVDNPLEIDTDKALKPLYDAWKSHANNITGVGKDTAEYLGNVHGNLSQVGAANGGTLNLDHIDQALSEVGPLTHSGSEANQALNRELFHSLADTRDFMVKTIADQAKNPSLAQNLLNRNKIYSQFIRVLPDVARASANASTGQKTLAGLFSDFQQGIINKTGLGLGSVTPSQAQAGANLAAKPILGKLGEKIEGQENP